MGSAWSGKSVRLIAMKVKAEEASGLAQQGKQNLMIFGVFLRVEQCL